MYDPTKIDVLKMCILGTGVSKIHIKSKSPISFCSKQINNIGVAMINKKENRVDEKKNSSGTIFCNIVLLEIHFFGLS